MAKRWSGDGVRLCGTPGCTLPDFHAGPCSNAASLGRRREHNIKLPYNEKAAQQLLRGEAAAIKASKREQRERKKQQRPVAAERPVSPPPQQQRLPSGLARFYHPLEWGVPLREGPVEADPVPPSWRHEAGAWQLEQAADRIRSRRGVGEAEAAFMDLWNGAVQRSERRATGACPPSAAPSRSSTPPSSAASPPPSAPTSRSSGSTTCCTRRMCVTASCSPRPTPPPPLRAPAARARGTSGTAPSTESGAGLLAGQRQTGPAGRRR